MIGNFISDFWFGLRSCSEALLFIRRHRLWTGIWNYGWLSRFLLVVGLLIGLKFFGVFWGWASHVKVDQPQMLGASVVDLYKQMIQAGYSLFFMGWLKYVILILTEVIVFHFVRRSSEILTGQGEDASFKTFLGAQKRMIKVVLRARVLEIIFTTLAGIALGIFSLDFLKDPVNFGLQCYFMGFTIVDNYNERYHISVKDSAKRAKEVAGTVVAIGLCTYVLLLVPLLGAFVAPFIAGVAATLAFFELEKRGVLPPLDTPVASEQGSPTDHQPPTISS